MVYTNENWFKIPFVKDILGTEFPKYLTLVHYKPIIAYQLRTATIGIKSLVLQPQLHTDSVRYSDCVHTCFVEANAIQTSWNVDGSRRDTEDAAFFQTIL